MLLNPYNKTARFALVGVALLVLGVGACTTETTTQIEAGQQAHIGLKLNGLEGAKSADLDQQLHLISDFIAAQPGVEELNVNVNETIDGSGDVTTDLGLLIWGEDLDTPALTAALHEEFPALADASIDFEPLHTTITENLFGRLGREVFNLETDGASAEEIRARILEQLAAQGFSGDATVEVIADGELHEVKIQLEENVTE